MSDLEPLDGIQLKAIPRWFNRKARINQTKHRRSREWTTQPLLVPGPFSEPAAEPDRSSRCADRLRLQRLKLLARSVLPRDSETATRREPRMLKHLWPPQQEPG